MGTASATGPGSRSRGSDDIVEDFLDAAEVEFAAHGFEGASTRSIAIRAGAHQPQINYHFTSKELLWRAVVDRLFHALDEAVGFEPGGSAHRDMMESVRRFVDFSARRPTLNRIINLEATGASDRLTWLVETHLRPRFAMVADLWERARLEGRGADLSASVVFDLLTSFGALRFANAPMVVMLEGTIAVEPREHADRLLSILFPGAT